MIGPGPGDPAKRVSHSMPRVIVGLTLIDGSLYRTRGFAKPAYVGDPINAVHIFNEKGVDELVLLDISGKEFDAVRERQIRTIAGEAFAPIGYGGGIRTIEHVRTVIRSGFEKVVLNTALHLTPQLAREAANEFGAQAVVGSIETRRGLFRGLHVRTACGRQTVRGISPVDWARRCEESGCGELLVTSIDRDGSMAGYDLEVVSSISAAVSVPVIAMGGAGTIEHLREGVAAGASAVAAGSMFVYFGPRRAVLINYPDVESVHGSHWA